MRPHDLLRLSGSVGLRHERPAPTWVRASLVGVPFVVVRRERTPAGLIPVGARGHTRGERFAALLAPEDVAARVTPEDLAAARGWHRTTRARSVTSMSVLDEVDELFTSLGLDWGPTGSVGFELATGAPVVDAASDLDVVVRAPDHWPVERAREIADRLNRLTARVDAQLDTPGGAVALAEYAGGGRVLLRTPDGPRLTHDPWREPTLDLRSA